MYDTSSFFTPFDEMPMIESEALSVSKGRVLDVGAGAGRHAVLLNETCDVTAIDSSLGAVEVMKKRGIEKAFQADLWKWKGEYDTILLMMNGIGLAGSLANIPKFLAHLDGMLAENGQILTDSCDMQYLFADGESLLQFNEVKDYYGEVSFQFKYKNHSGAPFNWVYVDERNLAEKAYEAGFKMEILSRTERHGQYLARLTKP